MTHHSNIFSCLNDLVNPSINKDNYSSDTTCTSLPSDYFIHTSAFSENIPINHLKDNIIDISGQTNINSNGDINGFHSPGKYDSFLTGISDILDNDTSNLHVTYAKYGMLKLNVNDLNPLSLDILNDQSLDTPELDDSSSHPVLETDATNYKKLYIDDCLKNLKEISQSHQDMLAESFFLENGGNLMEFEVWRSRPNSLLDCFLRSQKLEEFYFQEDNMENNIETEKEGNEYEGNTEPDEYETDDLEQTGEDGLSTNMNMNTNINSSIQMNNLQLNETSNQDTISDLAKQEAQVMKQISDLRKKGLWSNKRLIRTVEPAKKKAHWDYMMEEVQWLSNDFTQERKIKKAGARKVAKIISRHFLDLQQKGLKAEREDAQKLRRIAGHLGRMVREFWANIRKVVEYKQQSRMEEKRKKMLDFHLNFIVGQTEKYSTWLTQGLVINGNANKNDENSIEAEVNNETKDVDLKKNEIQLENLTKNEPSEKPILKLEIPVSELNELVEVKEEIYEDADSYVPSSDDDADDEMTLDEEEEMQPADDAEDVGDEIKRLQEEGEMSIEELLKLYSQPDDGNTQNTDSLAEKATQSTSTDVDNTVESKQDNSLKNNNSSNNNVSDNDEDFNSMAKTALMIQPTGNTLQSAHVKTAVPFLLKHTMREYQHVGLEWLATMYERRLNGILADEMGLGKTIQTIALLSYLACEKGIWGPHLIIVPTSVILNWEIELKKWCPAFKLLTYYGSQKERKAKRTGWTKTNAFHVCITSYKLVIQDHQAFRRKKWKYFILDEAQNIKNFRSQRWQTLLNFHSQRRLLLTGTPLQNSLMELWSLMHFLMPHIFQSHGDFKEWFANPLTGMIEGNREYNEGIVRRLHKVLRPFLLRRLKNDVEKQMPKKYEHLVMCRLSKRQRFLYDDYMSQTKTKETLSTGHYMSVINVLMQLRKVCNHPNLFDPRPTVSPFFMEGIQCSLPHQIFGIRTGDEFYTTSIATHYFPLLLNELSLTTHSAKSIRNLDATKPLIVELNSQEEEVEPIYCEELEDEIGESSFRQIQPHLNLGQMVNRRQEELILNKRKKIKLNSKRCDVIGPLFGLDLLDWLEKSRAHPILSFLVQSDADKFEQMFELLKRFVFVTPTVTSLGVTLSRQHLYSLHRDKVFFTHLKSQIDLQLKSYHEIAIQQRMQFPELRLIQYDCGKLQTLDVLLRRLKKEDHRVLIFTQMTRMLDILELFLNYHAHRYLRLDGSTKIEQRQTLMDRFNMDRRIFCFILSTRSGGIGVNLTGADTVIFYDSDWNPTMDAQAQDRCHRIGQTRDVHIYRLISEKTIEENILKKANEKRLLGNVAIEGGNFTTAFFKQQTIKDLFSEPSGLECLLTRDENKDATLLPPLPPAADAADEDKLTVAADVATDSADCLSSVGIENVVMVGSNSNKEENLPSLTEDQMEQALCMAEDEMDIQAIKIARAEQKLELIEFDESVSWELTNSNNAGDQNNVDMRNVADGIDTSNLEVELAMIDKELSAIERYAVTYLENQMWRIGQEELLKNEDDVMLDRDSWELDRLKEVKEAEERMAEMEEDEILYASVDYTPQRYTAPMVCSKEQKVNRTRSLKDPTKHLKKMKKMKPEFNALRDDQNMVDEPNETSIVSDPSDSFNDGRSKRSATFKSRSKQKAMYYEDLMDYDFEQMIVNSDPKIKKKSQKRCVLQDSDIVDDDVALLPKKLKRNSDVSGGQKTEEKQRKKIKNKRKMNGEEESTSLSMECSSSPQMTSPQMTSPKNILNVPIFEKFRREGTSFHPTSSQRNIFQHLQNNFHSSSVRSKPSQFQITRLSGSLLNRPNNIQLNNNHLQLLQQHQQQQQLRNHLSLEQHQQILNQQQICLLMKQKQQQQDGLPQQYTTPLPASLNIQQQVKLQQARLQQQTSMQQQKITLQQLATLQQQQQQANLRQLNQELVRQVEAQQNQVKNISAHQSLPIKQNNNPIFVLQQQTGSPRPILRLPVIGQQRSVVVSGATTTVPILEKLAQQLSSQRAPVTFRLVPIEKPQLIATTTHQTVTLKTLMQNSLAQNQLQFNLGSNNNAMPPLLNISNSNYNNQLGVRSNYVSQSTLTSNYASQLGINSIYNYSLASNSINNNQLGTASNYNTQSALSSTHGNQLGQSIRGNFLDQNRGKILLSSIRLVPRSNQLLLGQDTSQIRPQVRTPQINQEQIRIFKYL